MLNAARSVLVVDLDHTLIRTDLLVETAFGFLGRQPLQALNLLIWLSRGKATLKRRLAEAAEITPADLPYDTAVLDRIAKARAVGAEVYLASASDERLVKAIADHLQFDGWFASDGVINLSAEAKAKRLVEAFGVGGFDYIGDSRADLPVWAQARSAITAGPSRATAARLAAVKSQVEHLPAPEGRPLWRSWMKLIRPHQWAKNALVGLPLLTAHAFTAGAALNTLLAFVAFSLCASSVYIINDLVDVQADRAHPSKRQRPFASGEVEVLRGAVVAPLLLAAAAVTGSLVSWKFLAVLALYYLATSAYTFVLKRKMMIDVVTLAGLYTVRVIGGAVAIGVPMSEWLLSFSMFIFLSLALIKRHSEMAVRLDAGMPDPSNRNYRSSDLPVLLALAAAAGYSAVILGALYLSSPAVNTVYHHPKVLWLTLPLVLYWVSRAIMLSHRRDMHDDPIVFALTDRISLATAVLVGVIGVVAL
ncbi:UbiA family prenyltransferase [Phenylobacterium glaciei]|uniref:UbiA family prenyltransferase n=1 Tax=Phenylobacterium glaciei TaxID=2803784 RepID=UPI003221DBC2